MNAKKILNGLMLLGCSAWLCACGGEDSSNTATATITTVTENTTVMTTEETTEETSEETAESLDAVSLDMNYEQDMRIVENSFLSGGNNLRIKRMLNKAAKGEPITVGFIGGSITYGYKVNNPECFATLYTNWLSDQLHTEVKCVNAGISGTPSVLGNLRVDDQILAEKPDMVVVEFAVNDGGDTIFKFSYESLINRILKAENEPAVMLLFTVTEEGHTCEKWMKQVGEHYELPMVSVVQSMKAEVDAGNISYEEYSGDGVHPNIQGHKWITEYLAYATQKINEAETSEKPELPSRAVFASYYENLNFHNRNNLEVTSSGSWTEGNMQGFTDIFGMGWKYVPGEKNEPLTFKADCRVLMLIYKEVPSSNKKFGAVDVYIDGEVVKTINAATPNGWNEPTYSMLLEELDSSEHTIEIKAKNGCEDKEFEIMGFAWMK